MKAPVLLTLNICEYTLMALCFSKKQVWLFCCLGFKGNVRTGNFNFVSAQPLFLQAGQTAADQQEIHL